MKIKLKDGSIVEADKEDAVLLIASGEGERVLPEPEDEEPKKSASKKTEG